MLNFNFITIKKSKIMQTSKRNRGLNSSKNSAELTTKKETFLSLDEVLQSLEDGVKLPLKVNKMLKHPELDGTLMKDMVEFELEDPLVDFTYAFKVYVPNRGKKVPNVKNVEPYYTFYAPYHLLTSKVIDPTALRRDEKGNTFGIITLKLMGSLGFVRDDQGRLFYADSDVVSEDFFNKKKAKNSRESVINEYLSHSK